MRFSIVIPTQDRPQLLRLVVEYVMKQNYKDIEVIVSDNSTSAMMKSENKKNLESYIKTGNVNLINPDRVLSAPENFELCLSMCTGDYIAFLTDKMVLLPKTLEKVKKTITKTKADIINWTYVVYNTSDISAPEKDGGFYQPNDDGSKDIFREYDPKEHLTFKASGIKSRLGMSGEEYIMGKVCFGCYSKKLIDRVLKKSGALFGGMTHDYSALVQALSLATKAAILTRPGIVFIGLPPDKSLGTLTQYDSAAAKGYYQAFPNYNEVMNSLLVKKLYASQHNMVASDYVKYLKLYSKEQLFCEKAWLSHIHDDLPANGRVWESKLAKYSQYWHFYCHAWKYKDLMTAFLMKDMTRIYTDLKEKVNAHVETLKKNWEKYIKRTAQSEDTDTGPADPFLKRTPLEKLVDSLKDF